jgi:AcrR family transcriptional regulator
MSRAAREQQLLDVAEETFAEQGYTETTMEQIAARAGITKPVIYDHFGSKERLLAAVVARNRHELLGAGGLALTALGPRAEPLACFRAGVTAFVEFYGRNRDSFRTYQQQTAILATAGGDTELLRQAQAADLADRLRLLPPFPDVSAEARLGLAEIVLATNERATAWWLRHPEASLDEAVDLVVSVIWFGMGAMAAREPVG